MRFNAAKLNYWRTKDKAEVDFVIEAGRKLIPIEVKYKQVKRRKVPSSLRSFIEKYNPENADVVNLTLVKTLKIHNTTLYFLPFNELLRPSAIIF